MSTNKESDQMNEKAKEAWLDYIETLKNMRLLWDPKDKHYTNRHLRVQSREKLLEKFRKIDVCATVMSMKKRINNMRTAYNRERKKVMDSLENGGSYRPTLWYYDLFTFYEPSDEDTVPKFNTIKYFKSSMPGLARPTPEELYGSERTSHRIKGFPREEDEDTDTRSPPPKRRIYHLLQKQEKFIDTASKMLVRKEGPSEVHGKAIGLQLDKLDDMQQTIANKLIADTIYYGSLGKLTTDSYVHIEDFQILSPELGKVETLEDYDDNSCASSKEEILLIQGSPSSNDDDDE